MPISIETPRGTVEFPDGTPTAQIEAALAAEFGSGPDRTWVDTAIDALPLAGGIAGGVAGAGALSIPLAALGGAGGEGFRRTIQTLRGKRPIDKSASETVVGLADAAKDQAVGQAVGMGVGKGLQLAGKGAMRMAFGAQKGLRTKFPTVDLEAVALREGIGPGQMRAAAKASRGANEALAKAVQNADVAGAPKIHPRELMPRLRKLYDRANQARMPENASQIADEAGKLGRRMRGGISNADALVAKQERQALAKAALRSGTDPRAASVTSKVNAEVSRGLADALRKTPDVGKALDRSQEMMALERAVKSADNHTPMLRYLLPVAGAGTGYAQGGSLEDALVGAGATYAATNPRVLSLVARGANASAPLGKEIARLLAVLAQMEADK